MLSCTHDAGVHVILLLPINFPRDNFSIAFSQIFTHNNPVESFELSLKTITRHIPVCNFESDPWDNANSNWLHHLDLV